MRRTFGGGFGSANAPSFPCASATNMATESGSHSARAMAGSMSGESWFSSASNRFLMFNSVHLSGRPPMRQAAAKCRFALCSAGRWKAPYWRHLTAPVGAFSVSLRMSLAVRIASSKAPCSAPQAAVRIFPAVFVQLCLKFWIAQPGVYRLCGTPQGFGGGCRAAVGNQGGQDGIIR